MSTSGVDLDDATLAAIDGAPSDAPGRQPVLSVFATEGLGAIAPWSAARPGSGSLLPGHGHKAPWMPPCRASITNTDYCEHCLMLDFLIWHHNMSLRKGRIGRWSKGTGPPGAPCDPTRGAMRMGTK